MLWHQWCRVSKHFPACCSKWCNYSWCPPNSKQFHCFSFLTDPFGSMVTIEYELPWLTIFARWHIKPTYIPMLEYGPHQSGGIDKIHTGLLLCVFKCATLAIWGQTKFQLLVDLKLSLHFPFICCMYFALIRTNNICVGQNCKFISKSYLGVEW